MQGFNKYYPPDYDPSKGSLNAQRGTHALGARAKNLSTTGELVVRFELPFNIWCGSCEAHLGAGVRYNAKKRKVGAYHSTPIYAFRCKCHLCDGFFEIRTDPQNTRYVVHEGARQQNQEWDPSTTGGFAPIDLDSSASTSAADPFASMERKEEQKARAKTAAQRLDELAEVNDRTWADPYALSVRARDAFRKRKKAHGRLEDDAGELADRYGLPERVKQAMMPRDGGARPKEREGSEERRGEGSESEENGHEHEWWRATMADAGAARDSQDAEMWRAAQRAKQRANAEDEAEREKARKVARAQSLKAPGRVPSSVASQQSKQRAKPGSTPRSSTSSLARAGMSREATSAVKAPSSVSASTSSSSSAAAQRLRDSVMRNEARRRASSSVFASDQHSSPAWALARKLRRQTPPASGGV